MTAPSSPSIIVLDSSPRIDAAQKGDVSHISILSDDDVVLQRPVEPQRRALPVKDTKTKAGDADILELSTDDEENAPIPLPFAAGRKRSRDADPLFISSLPLSSSSPPVSRLFVAQSSSSYSVSPVRRSNGATSHAVANTHFKLNSSFLSDLSEIDSMDKKGDKTKNKSLFYFSDEGDDADSHPAASHTGPATNTITDLSSKFKEIEKNDTKKLKKPVKSKSKKTKQNVVPPPSTSVDGDLLQWLNYYKTADLKKLNEVNKTSKSKEELLSEMEMIADIQYLDMDNTMLEPIRLTQGEEKNVIRWKRHVHSTYYLEQDVFIPLEESRLLDEKFIVVYCKASDELANDLKTGSLQSQISSLRLNNKDCCIILVIEGQDVYFLKLKTIENRNYTKKVRERLEEGSQGGSNNKRKKKTADPDHVPITKAEYDEILIDLQIDYKIHLFPTKNQHDTHGWLKLFTYTISNLRYDKFERQFEFSSIGVVRSGTDKRDTYLKSLQHFKFVTPLVAEKIMSNFINFTELSNYMNLHKRLDKNGIRESVDLSLFKFFNCDNPNEILS